MRHNSRRAARESKEGKWIRRAEDRCKCSKC